MSDYGKRVLEKDGEHEYYFSFARFDEICNYYTAKRNSEGRYNKSMFKNDLSYSVNVSSETVKKWMEHKNGPSDLVTLKRIADFFNTNYRNLLICNTGDIHKMEEPNSNIDFSLSERDVVLQVYEMAIDYAYFEANRYKNALNNPELEDDKVFYSLQKKKLNGIYRCIDQNGLMISDESRKKLYRIVGELSMCKCSPESMMGRWFRLNPSYYDVMFILIGRDEVDDEEELQERIQDDVIGNFELQYGVSVDGEFAYELGYHKETTVDEIYDDIKDRSWMADVDKKSIKLIPAGEKPLILDDLDEMFRFEFVKTIIAVFREDFPEYFIK